MVRVLVAQHPADPAATLLTHAAVGFGRTGAAICSIVFTGIFSAACAATCAVCGSERRSIDRIPPPRCGARRRPARTTARPFVDGALNSGSICDGSTYAYGVREYCVAAAQTLYREAKAQ